ncbi:YlbL family protein [Corynebacterium doosanense]|uniref:Signal protein PDZ n=1 Tax=Corynebacterium doosanense CAU 212 = DSM 45436 TaxID=558173 RepID=A0A097IED5_9CORY|nr:signal protein PDZ [Corynebacterium doosanense CAU 212 = DSM 45436]
MKLPPEPSAQSDPSEHEVGRAHDDGDRAAPRRLDTALWGAVPVVVLASLMVMDHVPFTDISLAVPYAAEGPGPMFDTLGEVEGEQVVSIDGADTDETAGELNMTTVSVRTNMSLAQAAARWVGTDDDLVPIEQVFPPNVSEEDVQKSNEAAFLMSESAATVAAMHYLGAEVKVVVAEVLEGSPAQGPLQADDVITHVDGREVDQPGQVQDLVRAKKPGEEVALTVDRGGHEEHVTVTLAESDEDPHVPQVGILMTSAPVEDIKVNYNLQDVGGPSAGMMFSLAVIDKLSPGELNGGRVVAGTGTIAESGEVGPIGGIVHKVEAAEENGVELFLAPSSNCAEAMSRDRGDLVVASVDTLEDAVTAMEDFTAGRDVKTCQP